VIGDIVKLREGLLGGVHVPGKAAS